MKSGIFPPKAAKPIWPKPIGSTTRAGTFPAYRAEHFVWENREYILRSTWQNFELWRRNDAAIWEQAPLRRHAGRRAGCRFFRWSTNCIRRWPCARRS